MDQRMKRVDQVTTNRQIVASLVKGYGGNLGQRDRISSSTPLHIACGSLNDLAIIQILIEGGADLSSLNDEGLTPLQVSRQRLEAFPELE